MIFTEVIFESANFEGTNIRVSSKKLNLRSESSSRFDKDIDPNLAKLAIDRACALICELGCGEVMEGTIDVYNSVKEESSITVDSKWINKFLGTDISKEDATKISALGEVLTSGDIDFQEKGFKGAITYIHNTIQTSKEKSLKDKKIYRCLCSSLGLLIVILLF